MTKPLLPTANALLTPAIDKIVALRPESLQHFNSGGRWTDLPALWRAQILLNLARNADEVQSARLSTSKGESLRALCASEFDTVLPSDPQTATTDMQIARPLPGVGHAPAGIIRTGTAFVKQANPTGIPLPVAAATYRTTKPIYYQQDQTFAIASATADSPGADANLPIFTNYDPSTLIQPGDALFDATLEVIVCDAGGGSSGITDPVLIAAAKAYAIGQFGPTDGAIVAGVLRNQSVRHFATFRANGALPYAQMYIADESWGWSSTWMSGIQQDFADNFQGFGCRVRFGLIDNQQIALQATIVLKSTDDLNNTDDIDTSVRAMARSYFDDRPDWYRWRLETLKAVLSRCDPRIQFCSDVTVTDAMTGDVLNEPTDGFGLTWLGGLTHFYLTDDNCQSTYEPPS